MRLVDGKIEMFEVARPIILIQLIILSIIIISAWIYALPIIFIRRFHTVTNILTCNVCLVSILASLYWTMHYVIDGFYPTILRKCTISCTIIPYFQTMVNCLVIYAFLMITINRYGLIIYPNKTLFKRLIWSFISFVVDWLISIILPLPYLILLSENCVNSEMIPLWIRVYRFFVMVILPSILNGIFNLLIFFKVKSSTQHLNTGTMRILNDKSNEKYLNGRDLRLLKHMLFLHIVFVIGWVPISLLFIIEIYIKIPYFIDLFLHLLPALSLLIDILDLYLYNRELRQYFKEQFFKSFVCHSKN